MKLINYAYCSAVGYNPNFQSQNMCQTFYFIISRNPMYWITRLSKEQKADSRYFRVHVYLSDIVCIWNCTHRSHVQSKLFAFTGPRPKWGQKQITAKRQIVLSSFSDSRKRRRLPTLYFRRSYIFIEFSNSNRLLLSAFVLSQDELEAPPSRSDVSFFFNSFVHIVFPRLYRLWLTFPLECSFIFVFSCDRKAFLSQFCRCVLRCYLRGVIIVIVCSMGNSSRETRRFYLSIPKRRHTLWRFSKEQDFLYLWVFFQF